MYHYFYNYSQELLVTNKVLADHYLLSVTEVINTKARTTLVLFAKVKQLCKNIYNTFFISNVIVVSFS